MIAFASKDLGLRPAQWKAVARKAKRAGRTAPEYVRLLIEQDLLAEKSFDELLRPIRRDVQRAGVTEADVDAIVTRARASTRRKSARSNRGAMPR